MNSGVFFVGAIFGAIMACMVVGIVYVYSKYDDLMDRFGNLDKRVTHLDGEYYRYSRELREFKNRVIRSELDIYDLQNGKKIPQCDESTDSDVNEPDEE